MTVGGNSSVIRVGGVPEHFNYPWHLALERGLFTKHGVNVEWVEQKEGTGQMIKNVKEGVVDIIIALTEGLVADIAKGSDLRLISTYVESPLCWAVITGAKSNYESIEDLQGQTFGISRYTSGSHLMAYVLAIQRGWNPETDVKFDVKGSFENLRNGVNDNSTAAFMWETFTTKPYFDAGEVRKIGEIYTPWPCFMIAATKQTLDEKKDDIEKMLIAVREACAIFNESESEQSPSRIASRYGLVLEDAQKWFEAVKVTATSLISEASLDRTVNTLHEAKVLPNKNIKLSGLIDPRFAKLQTDIKKMKLYNKPELVARMYNDLRASGMLQGPIQYERLLPMDQHHHYHGTDAIDQCAKMININGNSSIISLGSGLGGPARYIAHSTNAQVLAIDIQDDLHATACEITSRCVGLSSKITHICGDFLKVATSHLRPEAYDGIVSWLTVLHIPEREKLFNAVYSVLKPGGYFYAEDFYDLTGNLTAHEKQTLEEDVFCKYLPTLDKYKADIEKAGLTVVQIDELTQDWREYTKERARKFEEEKEAFVKIHGEDIFNRLLYFYKKIAELYAGGNLGGVRIVAQKSIRAPKPEVLRSTVVELDW